MAFLNGGKMYTLVCIPYSVQCTVVLQITIKQHLWQFFCPQNISFFNVFLLFLRFKFLRGFTKTKFTHSVDYFSEVFFFTFEHRSLAV